MEIVTYPHPTLRQQCEEITNIDDEIVQMADAMTETLFREEGLGLAAPQVGKPLRLIIVNVEEEFHVLLNPEIVEKGDRTELKEEGCLSIPGPHEEVSRALNVVVRGIDLKGNEVKLEREGTPARVLQHEIDHLEGTLFIDHLSETARSMALKEYRKEKAKH